MQLCASTCFCKAFTFRTPYSGCPNACYMKRAPTQGLWGPISDGTAASLLATSGIMPIVVAETTMLTDSDYGGNTVSLHNCPTDTSSLSDKLSYPTMTAEMCAAGCVTSANCTAYSFIANASKPCPSGCYLKNPVPALNKDSSTFGVITGTVSGRR